MEVQEILRPSAGNYVGSMPSSISHTSLTIDDLTIYRQLQRVPPKITAYFDETKIAAVHKSDCFKDPDENYYIITATDGTLFHVEY